MNYKTIVHAFIDYKKGDYQFSPIKTNIDHLPLIIFIVLNNPLAQKN